MKNPLRRTLSFLLALVLAFSPLTAAAEGSPEDTEEPEIIEQITEELPEESEEPEDPTEESEPIEESLPTEPKEPVSIEIEREETVPDEDASAEAEEPELPMAVPFAANKDTKIDPYLLYRASVQSTPFEMSGETFPEGIILAVNAIQSVGHIGTALVSFNLQGKCEKVSFVFGAYRNPERSVTLTVTADGENLTPDVIVDRNAAYKAYSFNLKGVEVFTVRIDYTGHNYDYSQYAMADIKFQLANASNPIDTEAKPSNFRYNCEPHDMSSAGLVDSPFSMGGYSFDSGIQFTHVPEPGYFYAARASFSFEKHYKHISFYIGFSGTGGAFGQDAKVTIIADGVTIDEFVLSWDSPAQFKFYPLDGVKEFTIKTSTNAQRHVRIGNIQMKSDGKVRGITFKKTTINATSAKPEVVLEPVVIPIDANNQNYKLSTGDYSVVFLVKDKKDTVCARNSGKAVITATTEEGKFTADCTINSSLPELKYLPSNDAWGIRNFQLGVYNNDFRMDNYYKVVYERVIGNNLYNDSLDVKQQINHTSQWIWYTLEGNNAWNGVCYGLSISSVNTFTGALPFSAWTDWESESTVSKPYDVKGISEDDPERIFIGINKEDGHCRTINMYFKQYLLASYLDQFSKSKQEQRKANVQSGGDYTTLFNAVKNFQSTGKNPIDLAIHKVGFSGSGNHALLPYQYLETEDRIYLFVYDSNAIFAKEPQKADNQKLVFQKDASGKITSWKLEGNTDGDYSNKTHKLSYRTNLSNVVTKLKKGEAFDIGNSSILTNAGSADIAVAAEASQVKEPSLHLKDNIFLWNTVTDVLIPIILDNGESIPSDYSFMFRESDAPVVLKYTDDASKRIETSFAFENSVLIVDSAGDASVTSVSDKEVQVACTSGQTASIRFNSKGKGIEVSGKTNGNPKLAVTSDDGQLEVSGFSQIQVTVFDYDANTEKTLPAKNVDAGKSYDIAPDGTFNGGTEIPGGGDQPSTPGVVIASGTCGTNLTWELDDKGTLTISGTGAMTDYTWEDHSPWHGYNSQIKSIVIRNGVTTVSQWAFDDCFVETVSLPDSLESIMFSAFSACSNLRSLSIPAGVSKIHPLAFQLCSSLKEFQVDSKNVNYCSEDGVLFSADKTKLVCYPGGADRETYTVPNGVKRIESNAFYYPQMKTLRLPASFAVWDTFALDYAQKLKDIYVDADNSVFTSVDGVLFDKSAEVLVFCPIAHTESAYRVPYGTKQIKRDAFENGKLERVMIPETVTSIGGYAFAYCNELKEAVFLGSAPEFSTEGGYGEPNVFSDVTATAYYPAGDSSWTEAARKAAGGNLTWIAKPLDELQSVYFGGLDMDAFAFEQEYLALRKGETAQVELTESFAALIGMVKWSVERSGTAPVSVDKTGKITALRAGTAEVVASITVDGETYSARCRVDVTDNAVSSEAFRNGITLVTDKVTTELYRTDYTRITFAVNLTQNMTAFAEGAGENTGHAVRSARFYDSAAAQCFDLRVADDRTLEIIPTAYAIANPKAVKNVKSAILLDVDGSLFITSPLTLTVKKTLPTIKAKAVKFNSFEQFPTAELTFTGGNVLSVEPAGYLPYGFRMDGMDLIYYGSAPKTTAKLNLLAEVERLAVKRPVTVSVSIARTEPTVKLSSSSVTLLAGSKDKVTLTVNQSGPLNVAFYSDGYNVSNSIVWKLENGEFTIFAPGLSFAGKTLKCSVNVPGSSKKANLTVKVPAAKPSMTLKASGAVDMAIQGSPVTITPKFTGYHAGNGENYTVKILQSTTNADVSRLFNVNPNNGVLTITAAGSIPQGYTYTAYVTAVLDNSGMYRCEKSVKLPVKWSDPNKVPVSVTLKAKGSIDVIHPDTSVVITPAVKNWFGFTPSENDLVFYKNKVEITGNVPFTVEIVDGCYVVTNNGADSSAKYTVAFRARINRIPVTSKPISLSVKMASVKVTQDVKTVTLLKNDRYDSQMVQLTAPAGTKIEKIGYSSEFFTVTPLGQNRYSISFRNNIPAPKGQTIKLSVYLEGNLTAKPNAAISVKVNLK